MAMFPRSLAAACSSVLELWELRTVGDVLTASTDAEVEANIPTEQKEAWDKLVQWATAKHEHILDRISRDAASGHAPRMRLGSDDLPAPPPPARMAPAPLPASKRRRVVDVPAAEQLKRQRAAAGILKIVHAAGPKSKLATEFDDSSRPEWETSFLEVLTGGDTQAGFEHKTLQKASAAWRRWESWLTQQHVQGDPFQPTPIHLSAFLKSVSKKGPTAAQGIFTSFEWLRKHAGLDNLPLQASVVEHFKHPHAGHLSSQQPPLSIDRFGVLVGLLNGDAKPWVKCAAALVLRVTLSGLRLAHVARASRVRAECTERTTVWRVTRGKGADRAGFKTAAPTHPAPGLLLDAFINDLQPEHEDFMDFLLPDLRLGVNGLEGDCSFRAGRMSRAKFLDMASWLLSDTQGDKITGYTFRRFLPTVADALQFSVEKRQCLGNWVDAVTDQTGRPIKEPMSVRYSQARLENTAQVKRVCLAAVIYIHQWAEQDHGQAKWEHMAGCIKSLPTLEENTRRSRWGASQPSGTSMRALPAAQVEVSSDDKSSSSSKGSSASTTSTSSGGDETDSDHLPPLPAHLLEEVQWVAPKRSKKVHVRRMMDVPLDEPSVMPLCRPRPYVAAYICGTGVSAAAKLGHGWCGACVRLLTLAAAGPGGESA